MPEIAPDADFTPNIVRRFTERSMVLQAWGAYGVLWPVIAQQLGVAPDLGRDSVSVAPLLPSGQNNLKGSDIRLGDTGAVTVHAQRGAGTATTTVNLTSSSIKTLKIGHTLKPGEAVASVRRDGKPVAYQTVSTTRGTVVQASTGAGQHRLVVVLK